MKPIAIHGVPTDLGTKMRGSCVAPAHLRFANLHGVIEALQLKVHDDGDVYVPVRESLPARATATHHVREIADISAQLARRVFISLQRQQFPLVIGGDHSIAIGSVCGASSYFAARRQKIGLIWVDAHADLNSNFTSTTQNIHGMPLYCLLGKVAPQNIALIGARMIDPPERELCEVINNFPMHDINKHGMQDITAKAIAAASAGTDAIYVSFDLDAIDPTYAPAVNTPVMGGITYREAWQLLATLHRTGKVCGMDLVEYNPLQDSGDKTARLACELVQAMLGKTKL
ncbi:MAG: arginase [Pseudomonadota bacterium]|nr:arginase [Pseudomonadota bacterium]